jgi:5'(3')-deoxyribonucleotidase
MKKILYIDMDNVLVDFQSGIDKLTDEEKQQYEGRLDDVPGIFGLMEPLEGSIEAFNLLSKCYETYILSTAPWNNPSAWIDKHSWVRKHLGDIANRRLILTHHKNLNKGDFLIDDRPTKRGVDKFEGEVLSFGPGNRFQTWKEVIDYLTSKANFTRGEVRIANPGK